MTRHITKLLLAASALTVLAAAPAAYAAPAVDTKLFASKKISKTSTKTVKVADRGDKSNRNRGNRSDRNRSDRNRGNRSDRQRGDRSRGHNHRSDRNRGHGSNRGYRQRDRHYRQDNRSRNYYRPARRNYSRRVNNQRGYYTPYRSNIGISFNFGTPGYSSHRWAPGAHSFYRPTYGSYGYYQRSTTCRRINVEGWHHGHRELVSVKQCSNPWDGTYIVQGSERVVSCRW